MYPVFRLLMFLLYTSYEFIWNLALLYKLYKLTKYVLKSFIISLFILNCDLAIVLDYTWDLDLKLRMFRPCFFRLYISTVYLELGFLF